MGMRHQFRGALITFIAHNRDGAKVTQSNRRHDLLKMAEDLFKSGIKIEHPRYLRQRHIQRLVDQWKNEGISSGTLKNRMAHIRWLCEKLGKVNMVPSNTALTIPQRVYVTNQDKSRELTEGDLTQIRDPYMKLSLRAQALFGLRFEESLKIQPHLADGGKYLMILGSWSKGGKDRLIPVTNEEQRDWLEEAKQTVLYKDSSLIPAQLTYKAYRSRVSKRCERAGIHKLHGHRHAYAQQRYKELTGWGCPARGGPLKAEMTQAQRQLDKAVRLQLSIHMGHERASVLNSYLGSVNYKGG